jgi:hypothetical protein
MLGTADRSQVVDPIVNLAGAFGALLAVYGRVAAKSAIKPGS